MFPFRSGADALAWEQSYASGGHQPWHLDAGQTALSFTSGYLGFTEIDTVVSSHTDSKGAHIAVGFKPAGVAHASTAAVVHLVRWGSGSTAPWEVVGTEDTTLTLTMPHYGSTVASPLTVGGTITGVDESLRVSVHQLTEGSATGETCCLAAGGTANPWSTTVSYSHATADPMTIVVSTGGHLQRVERFAITAVIPSPGH